MGFRRRVARVATAVLALAMAGTGTVEAAPPSFAGTTVITARGNGGVVLQMPKTSHLDLRGKDPKDYAVTITRRGGTYAFVGLSEPEACKRYNDPYTAMCLSVHGYDFGAFRLPGQWDWWEQEVMVLDPAIVGKGRIDVYVLTDGEVTLTLRFKGLRGTRKVRADRKITGWMRQLPNNCVDPCEDVAFGGAAYDVGPAGFVAATALAVRDPGHGQATPMGPLGPGAQLANMCIYGGGDDAWEASPDPAQHPTGCDPVGNGPLQTTADVLNAPNAVATSGNASGWSQFDYGARGQVYVGYYGAVTGLSGEWHALAGYGVWLRDGIR